MLALAALAAGTGIAHADVSSTITATTDYDFRGITQTAQNPALQASLDWSGASGFYAGAWTSNVNFGKAADADVEVDVYGGYKGKITDDLTYDVGGIYYTYWPDKDKFEYPEVYANFTYKIVSAKVSYSWNYGNVSKNALYTEVNPTIPLPGDFGLVLHAGYSSGEYWKDIYGKEYFDYAVGVSKTLGNFGLTLKWIDGSDLEAARSSVTGTKVFTSDARVVFSVATTLPWK
jgi:uncharacterized protein (TIGR02001 family)